MKSIERSAIVPFSAQQMYDLVNDIESYPDFVKGCQAATVLEKEENCIVAELQLAGKGLQQALTTRNTLIPAKEIRMKMVKGPFKTFEGMWYFESVEKQACRVRFRMDYAFGNALLNMAAGKAMNTMANDQVEAMVARAHAVYSA